MLWVVFPGDCGVKRQSVPVVLVVWGWVELVKLLSGSVRSLERAGGVRRPVRAGSVGVAASGAGAWDFGCGLVGDIGVQVVLVLRD